jgi:hypothetical protein
MAEAMPYPKGVLVPQKLLLRAAHLEARQTRDYCLTKSARHHATRPGPSLGKIKSASLRMTIIKSSQELRAPAGTPTAHATVATPIARHDAAAEAAGWSITQVHNAGKGIGGVD